MPGNLNCLCVLSQIGCRLLTVAIPSNFEHAELSVTQNIFSLFAALTEAGTIGIEDDLIFLLNDGILLPVIFD